MGILEFFNNLRRFGELSIADKWLVLRAAGWLAVARIQLAFTPFDRLAARLSQEKGQGNASPDTEFLSKVSFAVAAAAANVPWRSDCFPQAIAARKLLQGHGFGSTIHLGVAKSGDDVLTGHAWLTCGSTVVTGGDVKDRYTEVHRL